MDTTRSRTVLATVLATTALTHFDSTMVAIALPRIRIALGADDGQLHWVVTAYLLAFGLVLLLAGRLGDVVGRRAICLTGQGVFLAGAMTAAISPGIEVLILARVAQGLGAGLLLPQGAALIQSLVAPARRGRAFAALGVAISAATVVGPVVSGAFLSLVDHEAAWRLLFILGAPVSVVVLVLVTRHYPGAPEKLGRGALRQVDLPGAALGAVAVGGLVYPLLAEASTPLSQRPWFTLPIGALMAVAVVLHVRARAVRGEAAIIDPGLRRLPGYLPGAAVSTLYFAGFTAVPVLLSLLLQESHGLSPLQSALLMAPWAVGNGLSAPWGGRRVAHRGRRVTAGGATITTLAVTTIAIGVGLLPPEDLAYLLAPAMFLGGIGSGLTIGPNLTVTLRHVEAARSGGASAVLQTGQRLSSAVGVGVSVGLLLALRDRGDGVAAAAGVGVSVLFILAAALVAVTDVVRSRGRGDP